MEKLTYQAIEDNGGGLTLVIFDAQNEVVYLHSGYEYNPGQLTEDLDALKTTDPRTDWEGNSETPQGDYDQLTSYEYGWQIVADDDGIYPDVMGAAARKEFDI
jgi:hypothetical protein